MKLNYRVLFIIILFVILYLSCNTEDTVFSPDQGEAILRIYLTDAPAGYDSVNIKFSEISAHLDSTWILVRTDPVTVNLLDWTDGRSIIIADTVVPAGLYTQIRLKIDDAWVVINDVKHIMDVPSGAQTGLKLGPAFTVKPGVTYELLIDFDANRSVITTGSPSSPKGFKLKPHLRVVSKAVSGSISGKVSNPDNFPIVYAIQTPDTISSSNVNPADSTFYLLYLAPGNYTVSIVDDLLQKKEVESVSVTAGMNTHIGTVTLQ
jgi:hypothetical protein